MRWRASLITISIYSYAQRISDLRQEKIDLCVFATISALLDIPTIYNKNELERLLTNL